MKIVVLDALPLDAEGDLDWSPFAELGELTLYPNTTPEETPERIGDAEVVFTNKVRLRAEQLEAASALKLISVLATGYDIIEMAEARRREITVCNVPGYGTLSVAQTTIALLLELCHGVGEHSRIVRTGGWSEAGVWSFWRSPLTELEGKILLIVGLGAIGKRVARIGEALGMTVLAAQLPERPVPELGEEDTPRLPLMDALPLAEVISLHCPLTPETYHLFDADRLAKMRSGAFLINTARGALVHPAAVADALKSGQLGGYAADVMAEEPPAENNPLLSAPRCILTPHYAWASRAARGRLLAESLENLRAFLRGNPRNVVS